jgi:hypothetical protein
MTLERCNGPIRNRKRLVSRYLTFAIDEEITALAGGFLSVGAISCGKSSENDIDGRSALERATLIVIWILVKVVRA